MGPLIVSLMKVVLNVVAILVLVGGAVGGAVGGHDYATSVGSFDAPAEWAQAEWVPPVLGAVAGLVAAMLFIILFLGTIFLLLEIHKQIVRLNRQVENLDTASARGQSSSEERV